MNLALFRSSSDFVVRLQLMQETQEAIPVLAFPPGLLVLLLLSSIIKSFLQCLNVVFEGGQHVGLAE